VAAQATPAHIGGFRDAGNCTPMHSLSAGRFNGESSPHQFAYIDLTDTALRALLCRFAPPPMCRRKVSDLEISPLYKIVSPRSSPIVQRKLWLLNRLLNPCSPATFWPGRFLSVNST
jgi:hypothetical protein